jgi:hypothetical protein
MTPIYSLCGYLGSSAMVDLVSVLDVAPGVHQFVDFIGSLVRKSYNIYTLVEKGSTEESNLYTITNKLLEVNHN